MRNTNVPPVCRACAQLKSAVRTRPTCGVPVGDGQKRTRTSAPVAVEKGSSDIACQLSRGSSARRRAGESVEVGAILTQRGFCRGVARMLAVVAPQFQLLAGGGVERRHG